MNNTRYAELYDSWMNGNRTWVAEALLKESMLDVADFIHSFSSDRDYFEGGALLRLMRRLDRKQKEAAALRRTTAVSR